MLFIYNGLRAPARASILVFLALAGLVAFGWARLERSLKGWAPAATAVAGLALLGEYVTVQSHWFVTPPRPPQVMHAYYSASVPEPGRSWDLRPDDAMQSLQFNRPRLSELGAMSLTRVAISTAEAEAAEQLATWSVATLCRSLSLPNILLLISGGTCVPPVPSHFTPMRQPLVCTAM